MPPATMLILQPPAGVVPQGILSSDGLTGAVPCRAHTLRALCSPGAESGAPWFPRGDSSSPGAVTVGELRWGLCPQGGDTAAPSKRLPAATWYARPGAFSCQSKPLGFNELNEAGLH